MSIVCSQLTKKYGSLTAIDAIDLTLESGKIVGLLGPNGSGKTTLIKMINRLIKPTSGSITIEGQVPGVGTKARIAYLPDREFLPGNDTVEELIRMYSTFFADFDSTKAHRMLSELGINEKMRLKKLSKGNREKVQLLLTMSRNAEIYILDEPIAGVDPAARDYILKTILGNFRTDAMMIISTHLIADVETILDDVVFIKNGHIVLHQSADDLREEHNKSIDETFREVFAC